MNNDILENIKINLSKNGIIASNLITYLLLFKNIVPHIKLIKNYKKNEINSPYLKLLNTISYHPEILNRPAIIQDRIITYGKFLEEIEYISNFFDNEVKIKEHENVAICSDNSIEGITSFFALNSLNAVCARIFSGAQEEKFIKMLNLYQSKTILVDEKNLITLSKIIDKTLINNVVLTSKCTPKLIIDFKNMHPNINLVEYETVLKKGKELPPHKYIEVSEDDIAAILFTSGTSGDSKPIIFPNRSFTRMVDSVKETTNEKVADGEKVVGVVSLEYPYAANNSTTMILLLGKTLVLPEKDNQKLLDIFNNNIDKVQAVPNFYKTIENELEFSNNNSTINESLKTLDYIVTGGETYREEEKKSLLKRLAKLESKPLMIDGMGFGELGSATALKFGLSKYFLLMNGFEAKAIDKETGKVVPKGKEGVLCFTGPAITEGYYKDPEKTSNSYIKDEAGKIWFVSDTLGTMNGFYNRLFKLGAREREFFITKTENNTFVKVYAGNIENIVLRTGFVDDCIVVKSNNSASPTPICYVSLKKDCNLSKEEIINALFLECQCLEKFAQPSEYNIVDEIKRTVATKKDYNYYLQKNIETKHR